MQSVVFPNKILPYLLVAPQIILTVVFFFWPASQALYQSTMREDAVRPEQRASSAWPIFPPCSPMNYLNSLQVTVDLQRADCTSSRWGSRCCWQRHGRQGGARPRLLPHADDLALCGGAGRRRHAVAVHVQPRHGHASYLLRATAIMWDPLLNGNQAMTLVVPPAAWKQISYNFLFFVAGLQAIPKSLIEAASIDGARGSRRFWTIVFPLLAPTTFFLLVVNTTYAFFDTFGIIHAVTGGGPAKATETLVYKVYNDGFVNLNLGSSAAQSVILMVIVIALTAFQFRFVEKRVHYGQALRRGLSTAAVIEKEEGARHRPHRAMSPTLC
jgi:sn-glycerol 3-phosphate transport system permease protein